MLKGTQVWDVQNESEKIAQPNTAKDAAQIHEQQNKNNEFFQQNNFWKFHFQGQGVKVLKCSGKTHDQSTTELREYNARVVDFCAHFFFFYFVVFILQIKYFLLFNFLHFFLIYNKGLFAYNRVFIRFAIDNWEGQRQSGALISQSNMKISRF